MCNSTLPGACHPAGSVEGSSRLGFCLPLRAHLSAPPGHTLQRLGLDAGRRSLCHAPWEHCCWGRFQAGMSSRPPCPGHIAMSEGQERLPVALSVCVHVCRYVGRMFGHGGLCVCVCVRSVCVCGLRHFSSVKLLSHRAQRCTLCSQAWRLKTVARWAQQM